MAQTEGDVVAVAAAAVAASSLGAQAGFREMNHFEVNYTLSSQSHWQKAGLTPSEARADKQR